MKGKQKGKREMGVAGKSVHLDDGSSSDRELKRKKAHGEQSKRRESKGGTGRYGVKGMHGRFGWRGTTRAKVRRKRFPDRRVQEVRKYQESR